LNVIFQLDSKTTRFWSYLCTNCTRTVFFVLLWKTHSWILDKWRTWRTIIFCVFISVLHMFRATLCSSSDESIVSIQHLVYVTLCRWPYRVQVGKFLTRCCIDTIDSPDDEHEVARNM